MNSFASTPLQLPIPFSPLFSSQKHFLSPFISPYNGPCNNYRFNYKKEQEESFQNFQLEPEAKSNNEIIEMGVPMVEQNVELQFETNQLTQKETIISSIQIQIPLEMPIPIIIQKSSKCTEQHEEESDSQSFISQDNCQMMQKIKKIICVLIKHNEESEERINYHRKKCLEGSNEFADVFDVLLRKFRKLKKTKEEMTKYCMRKAFKFLSDKHKKVMDIKESGEFLKEYFERVQGEAFSVPFKKNSEEKTMNASFLKKVFSSQSFLNDYNHFLKTFTQAVDDDNSKKIRYLAHVIKSLLEGGSLKKLENVKRLPWTQSILEKTIDLAYKLTDHSLDNEEIDYQQKPNKSKPLNSPLIRRKSTAVSIGDGFYNQGQIEEKPSKKYI